MGNIQGRPVNFSPQIKVDGSSITSNFVQIFAGAESRATILLILNSCDNTIQLSFPKKDNQSTPTDVHIELEANDQIVLDIGANGDFAQNQIWVKHAGAAPTSGTLRIARIE